MTGKLVKFYYFTREQAAASLAFIGVLVFSANVLYAMAAAVATYFLAKTDIIKAMLTFLAVCVGIWIVLSSTGLLKQSAG